MTKGGLKGSTDDMVLFEDEDDQLHGKKLWKMGQGRDQNVIGGLHEKDIWA
jgi:hypothetical protein